jgi:hypothetical protein
MTLVLFILLCCPFIVSSDSLPYAEWAHYHMVWLPNSHSNQIDIQNMFNDYMYYDIQFGIVNIDSRWATGFNTFIFNSTTFPAIREMLDGFRAKDKHIVLWMTSFVNTDSPTYDYAQTHGYLFNKTIKWWHGEGRLLNYFNEKAVDWWHSQIERLVDTVGPIHAFKVYKSYFLRVVKPFLERKISRRCSARDDVLSRFSLSEGRCPRTLNREYPGIYLD